jgi:type 1 glutamine amidotransferase
MCASPGTGVCALYLRVSTADQGERCSLASQLRHLREKATRKGKQVREDYIFTDKHTGKLAARPEFDRMRALVRAWVATGKPKLVSDPPVPAGNPKSQFWIKPEQGKAVRGFVENGGSALFLHNVTHVGLTDPDFRHVLGAAYAGHPPIRTFKVKVKNAEHPITKGVRDFVVTDEQHYMEYDKDPKHLLLETVNEQGLTYRNLGATAPGGWAYDYGKGRVCYMSPGHLLSVLWNPEYVKLQHNAVRWLLR